MVTGRYTISVTLEREISAGNMSDAQEQLSSMSSGLQALTGIPVISMTLCPLPSEAA